MTTIGLPEALGTVLQERQLEVRNTPGQSSPDGAAPTSFADRLTELVEGVDQTQRAAESMAQGFADGSHNDIHGTMLALQKADVTLRLVGTVRNRAIEAYREIMRMGA